MTLKLGKVRRRWRRCSKRFSSEETPPVKVIKNSWTSMTSRQNKLECFVPGKPYQPNLIFDSLVQCLRVWQEPPPHLGGRHLMFRILALPTKIRPGCDLIKLFWHKFIHSFFKLENFINANYIVLVQFKYLAYKKCDYIYTKKTL